MQNKFSLKQKLLLILFGIIIVFLLAEGFFRISGFIADKIAIKNGIGFYDWEIWGGGPIPEWPGNSPVEFRWTRIRASMRIKNKLNEGLTIFLFSANPDINKNPLRVNITGDNGFIRQEVFTDSKWKKIVLSRDVIKNFKILTLQVSRTWSPKAFGLSDDDRELGVALALPSDD